MTRIHSPHAAISSAPAPAWSPASMEPCKAASGSVPDERVSTLILSFRSTGGLMTADEVANVMRSRRNQPLSLLAKRIVERKVVCFAWRSTILIPVFQVDFEKMEILRSVEDVLAELAVPFDDWTIAEWFSAPNCWIQDRAPCRAVIDDPRGVLQAARADRYIAIGW